MGAEAVRIYIPYSHSSFRLFQDERALEERQIEERARRKAQEQAIQAQQEQERLEREKQDRLKAEHSERAEREKTERTTRGGVRGIRGTRASMRGGRGTGPPRAGSPQIYHSASQLNYLTSGYSYQHNSRGAQTTVINLDSCKW